MAQLNGYTNSVGEFVPIVPRPVNKYSPNGISRITPKESRSYALDAYALWVKAVLGTVEVTKFDSILNGAAGWTGGTYLTFTDGTDLGYVWFRLNGVGSDPVAAGVNFGKVDVISTDRDSEIAAKLNILLSGLPNTQSYHVYGANYVEATNFIPGIRADATSGTLTNSVIIISVTQQGIDPVATPWDGVYTDHEGPQDLTYSDE